MGLCSNAALPVDREAFLREPELLEAWLRELDPSRLEALWQAADRVRRECVGDEVHLRGIIEISNFCVRRCAYCGIRAPNSRVTRYRMAEEEIVACAAEILSAGIHTVVLQAGEDPALDADWVARVIRRIKQLGPIAVTLSLGERSDQELRLWREVGADRYLVRFETSNPELYQLYHPPRSDGRGRDRLEMLRALRELDYEVGSGVMIGLPGQTWADLANDLLLFAKLDLDMIGCGPFILHPDTPLGNRDIAEVEGLASKIEHASSSGHAAIAPGERRSPEAKWNTPEETAPAGWPPNAGPEQVPADELTTYKVIALSRILCPWANIPATTALATINPQMGRRLGLRRGANVIMPNFTPQKYRKMYQIYPGKAETITTSRTILEEVLAAIAAEGRSVGKGPGTSPNFLRRKRMAPHP